VSATTASLRDLVDRPYELLAEMDRRARRFAGTAVGAGSSDWTGLAFRLGEEAFVSRREEVREVLAWPEQLTRIPGAKSWILGLANVRGQLLPVVDLMAFLGGPVIRPGRGSRVLVVNHPQVPAGLAVDEVLGFRRFADGAWRSEMPSLVLRCERYLGGAFSEGDQLWPDLSLLRLVESPLFLRAAAEADA
jgi:twitching motility protein PilI